AVLFCCVSDFRWVHAQIKYMARIEAEVRLLCRTEAAHKESNDNKQHQGTGHLCHDQSASQRLACADHTSAPSAKNRAQISTCGAQGGNDSDDDAGQERGAQSVGKNAPIQVDLKGEICAEVHRPESTTTPIAEQNPHRTTR